MSIKPILGMTLGVVLAINPLVGKAIEYGPIKKGDTLSQIAKELRPESPVEETIQHIFQENPHAFRRGNIHQLKLGVMLHLKDEKEEIKPTHAAGTTKASTASHATSALSLEEIQAEFDRIHTAIASLQESNKHLGDNLSQLNKTGNHNSNQESVQLNDILARLATLEKSFRDLNGKPQGETPPSMGSMTSSPPTNVESATNTTATPSTPKEATSQTESHSSPASSTTTSSAPAPTAMGSMATAAKEAPVPPPHKTPLDMIVLFVIGIIVIAGIFMGVVITGRKKVQSDETIVVENNFPLNGSELEDSSQLLTRAQMEYQSGNYNIAKEMLRRAILGNTENLEIRMQLIEWEYAQRDMQAFLNDAKDCLDRLDEPNDPRRERIISMGQVLHPGHPFFGGNKNG